MSAQRERLEASAANLANSNTTRTAEGGPYRRRDVVFESVAIEERAQTGASLFAQPPAGAQASQGVRAKTMISAQSEGVMRYQPDHPDADANGYVQMPDVDPLEETVNMISAARSFEGNSTAFNTAKEMIRASLKLGEA